MSRIPAAVLTLLAVAAVPAHGDTRMQFSTGDGDQSQFAIKGERIRMQGSVQDVVTLFDAATRELTVIEPSKRRYYTMDAETLKQQGQQISAQMQQMREQMERQLESLPEGQREMMREQMEQMMQSRAPAGAAAPSEVRIERRGDGGSVAGIACERVDVYADGELTQRLCVAGAERLGMPATDVATLRAMFATLADMTASFDAAGEVAAPAPAQALEQIGGVPIKATDAQGATEWALQSVGTAELDPARFRVPSGYQRIDPFAGSAGE